MSGVAFPKYALVLSDDAFEDQRRIDADLYPLVQDVLRQLQTDPRLHPERLSPASRDGRIFIYKHPDPEIQVTFEIAEEEKRIYLFGVVIAGFEKKKSIFISYSHKDEEWLELVKKFLMVLEQQDIIEFWDDTRLQPGEEWKAKIREKLDSSKAAVLLVSQDFLNSEFIGEYELPQLLADAKSEGKRIYWIPVRPSTVFDSHKEITRFESAIRNPRKSLADRSETERERVLAQFSETLSKLH